MCLGNMKSGLKEETGRHHVKKEYQCGGIRDGGELCANRRAVQLSHINTAVRSSRSLKTRPNCA